jgi:hypothetical protein
MPDKIEDDGDASQAISDADVALAYRDSTNFDNTDNNLDDNLDDNPDSGNSGNNEDDDGEGDDKGDNDKLLESTATV